MSRLAACVVVAAAFLHGCGPLQTNDERYELHLRLIKHETVASWSAANVTVANQVWQSSVIEVYDSASTDSAVSVPWPQDTCGLTILTKMQENTSEPMTNDSVLVLKEMLSDSSEVYATDAENFFQPFRPSTYSSDTVPVIIVPYLGLRLPGPGADIELHEFGGHTVFSPENELATSVWLASRDIVLSNTESILAHELGHLLLKPPPYTLFEDNATAFLNIMTYPDGRLRYRRKPGFSRALESVSANDTNVRQLIEVQASVNHNQCQEARFYAVNIILVLGALP
jgi:hypothetical protein